MRIRYLVKQYKNYCWIILLFLVSGVAAQDKAGYEDSLFKKYAAPPIPGAWSGPYYLAIWKGAIPSSIHTIRKIDEHAAIIRADQLFRSPSSVQTLVIAPANDTWKLPAGVQKHATGKTGKYVVTGYDIDTLLKALQLRPGDVSILSVNRPTHSVIIRCKPKYLAGSLLAMKEIIFADAVQSAHAEANIIGYDRSYHGINAVDFFIPGANGKNIVAGIKEQAPDPNDMDLWKRVLPSSISDAEISYHATVIASIIGGAGNSSYYGKGIAWRCNFFPSTYANLFADDAAILNANKVTVQNHSYGTIIQQFYGAEAVSYDLLTWNNKNYIPVFSAGNQGTSAATEGKYAAIPGFANLTGNFKMAKNIISVAAIDNKDIISSLSSAGPAYDGRLAPQIAALGPSGTSDAAAIVSGTIAVLQQVYADSNGNTIPPASLVKAVLYNTADDIGNTGIDYKTGYGLLNSYEAVRALQQKKYDGGSLANGQQWTRTLTVPVNTALLKVTLSWTDSAAAVNNNKAIVNDLDLEVVEIATGNIYKPWVLNTTPHADSLAKQPTRRRDSLNTAEQVSIALPAAGNYLVRVNGTSVAASTVPFHISFKTDTLNIFRFTNPLHAADVNREENPGLNIRWRVMLSDTTQTGNLYISYDNGSTWQAIGTSVKLARGKFAWPIKDTASAALLKMETPFGSFLSGSFIVSRITRVSVDFNCTDSFRLSWNKHVYAGAWKVYALTDSPYLKHIRTVTDTFAVFQNAAYPSRTYAVEPVLGNNLPAARSQALNIDQQGVHCFYKTLNYNLLDDNRLDLILELSVAGYADSIRFERVSQGGVLLQAYTGMKATNSVVYTQSVDDLAAGTVYFRARIQLKNGAVVYTDIVAVLTSGSRYITVYPNPVPRNVPLKFVLRQGTPADVKLCIYDIYGRLLHNLAYVPDKMDFSRMQPGVFIYKLVGEDGRTLETGKFIVQ